MNLILARHGNTFGPTDSVVWAGTSNDLPLVEKGIAQAESLGHSLLHQNIKLDAIYCSPLQRTIQHATAITKVLNFPHSPHIDLRLSEIDYGEWTGLTNIEIAKRFGEAELKGWDEQCKWPSRGSWGGSESQIMNEVYSFVDDLKRNHPPESNILVVTSNGKLRYFLKLVPDEFEKHLRNRTFKVKTGYICKIAIVGSNSFVSYWNSDPTLTTI